MINQSLLPRRSAVLLCAALVAGACSDSPSGTETRRPAHVEVVLGDDQIGTVGAELPAPIVFLVTDDADRPVRNQTITFHVVAGGGSVSHASATTDQLGLAQVRWTLGPSVMAEHRLEARVAGGPNGAMLTTEVRVSAGPAPAASLVRIEGTPQIIRLWEGSTIPVPLGVRVLDQFGNPVAGVPVTFTATAGGGTVTGAVATSGAMGEAVVGSWRLGAVGTNTLTATSGNLPPVVFTATARSLTPARVVHSAGQGQTAQVATNIPQPLAVIVENADGDALPGIPVTFTPGPNSGSVSVTSATTGTNGVATISGWFLGTTAGRQTLVAAASPTATFTFEALATAGSPRRLDKIAGDSQTASPGATLPIPPAVIVRDAYGNVVPNVPVEFSVYNGGGSITGGSAVSNAAGVATAGNWTLGPLSGTQTLRVSAPGVALDAEFTARARSGVASLITRHWQNPTSAVPGSEITLAVIVLDDIGEPMGGVPISFAPIMTHFGSGMIVSPSQNLITNAQGVASVRYVMPTNVYAYGGVTASGSGLQSLMMTVNQLVGTPKEIRVGLHSNPVVAGGELGRPTFSVHDQYGTALPMVQVTFTVTTGGGTVDGVVEKTAGTPAPPATTGTGPLWVSGPQAGVNTLVVSMPMLPEVPSVVITRTTLSPP